MLEVDGLRKRFGRVEAVVGLDLQVADGEVVALLGPNGAGKSTSIHMLAGLVRPDAGSVRLGGVDLTRLPLHRRVEHGLALLPQASASFEELSVRANLQAVLELHRLSAEQRRQRFAELVEQVGIGEILARRYSVLSGGERRRVEIAKALAGAPRLLLLDEPFAGLDPRIVEDLQGLLRRLAETGTAVLITDHNVHMALQMVDRASVMHRGRLVAVGRPAQIADNAEVKAIYLGEGFVLA